VSTNRRRLAAQRKKKEDLSLHADQANFIAVAKLRRPHGLKGEVLVAILSDFPERIIEGGTLLIGSEHSPITIRSKRSHNAGLLLSFDEFPTRQDVEGLQNQLLYVPTKELPKLEKGEYYHHQLLGLDVKDDQGNTLGILKDILVTGANDVYLVKTAEDKELLLPATNKVIDI
jgi:16S rRNA processing protein RimM